jgi:diacylglycerol kinase family enzyme
MIGSGEVRSIDTFTAGPYHGVGTFGIGFDAHIAHLFAKSPKRGYGTYVRLVLSEFSSYPAFDLQMEVDGAAVTDRLFLMTFANSSQFGNNAVIAPGADISDGLMDLAMVRPFPWYSAPHLIYRLTANSLDRSRFYRRIRGSRIRVINSNELKAHIDGEPVLISGDFTVELSKRSLKIIVPSEAPVGNR